MIEILFLTLDAFMISAEVRGKTLLHRVRPLTLRGRNHIKKCTSKTWRVRNDVKSHFHNKSRDRVKTKVERSFGSLMYLI